MLKIPRPDKSILYCVYRRKLHNCLVDNKKERTYTDKKRDIHEADIDHLRRSVEVYDDLCSLFPKDFERIDCVRSNKLMTIEEVHEHLWNTLQPLLPKAKPISSSQHKSLTPKQF
jgi:hypothetical protein